MPEQINTPHLHSFKAMASVDGKVTLLDDATVPFGDRGFLFGHGVFETILIAGNSIVSWNEHMARLMKGANRVVISIPNPDDLKKAVIELVLAFRRQNNLTPDALPELKLQVRLILTGGSGLDLKINKDEDGNPPKCRVALLCRAAASKPPLYESSGLGLLPVFDPRSSQLIETKSINYLSNMLALDAAVTQGFDDAIFYNSQGIFTECTTANFLWINKEDKICGAPIKNQCLPGTSLLSLVRGLVKKGHQFHEDPLSQKDLSAAKACFAISSVRGLTSVGRIGDHTFDLKEFAETKEYLNGLLFAEQKNGLVPIF